MGADRLAARVARTWWSLAVKNARERRTAILEALEELIPPDEYARRLVELTRSKDKRVRARGLELIAKLQGTVEDEGGPGQRVVVSFGSVLTGSRVEKHQGLSGRQEGDAPKELGSG